jgi:hypothetical protein
MPRSRNLHRGGECCVRSGDGRLYDYPLQEELLEGFDDSKFRAQTRAELLARGVPAEHLNHLFPDLEPI